MYGVLNIVFYRMEKAVINGGIALGFNFVTSQRIIGYGMAEVHSIKPFT